MKFKQKKKKEWQALAKTWAKVDPPFKPNSNRILLYKKLLKKYALGKKILILGATPELRDMLAKEKYEVTLIDQSPKMIKTMTSLRKTKSKEKIIIKNWFNYNPKEKFDAIFGDTIFNNVHLIGWIKLERKIASWLTPNGVFITEHCGIFNEKAPKYSFDDLIKNYRKNQQSFKDFKNKSLHHFYLWSTHQKKSCVVNMPGYDKKLKKLYKKGKITKKEYEEIRIPLDYRGVCLPGTKIKLKIKSVFKILEEIIEDKHPVYKNFYRLYVLKPK